MILDITAGPGRFPRDPAVSDAEMLSMWVLLTKHMKIPNLLQRYALIAIALVMPFVVSAAPPQLPHLFYGTVTVNGVGAAAGTVIVASVGGA